MERLDPDTVALLSRRAYDVAASTRGVKVFLNGKRIPIKVMKKEKIFYNLNCWKQNVPFIWFRDSRIM